MQSINNHIMKTKCPIGMKQMTLERKFHKLSLYTKKVNFDLCPVLPCFARMPHICTKRW